MTIWAFAGSPEISAEIVDLYVAETGRDAGAVREFRRGAANLGRYDDRPYSIYARLEETPDAILVAPKFPLLIDAPFALSWLVGLAAAGPLYLIDLPDAVGARPALSKEKLAAVGHLLQAHAAADRLTRLELSESARRCETEDALADLVLAELKTTERALSSRLDRFRQRYTDAAGAFLDSERLSPDVADAQFTYTMHGVFQKGMFLDRQVDALAGNGEPIRMLDMGGGYGALGAEMAARGHRATVLELEPAKVDRLGVWLADELGVADRLEFVIGDFQAIDRVDGAFDLICFFGALLYEDRAKVPALLRACADRLTEGGRLIVQELPKCRSKPDARDFHRQFAGPDLHELLLETFSEVAYFSPINLRELPAEQAFETNMLCEARK